MGTGPGKKVAHSAFPLRSLKFHCHDLIYEFFLFKKKKDKNLFVVGLFSVSRLRPPKKGKLCLSQVARHSLDTPRTVRPGLLVAVPFQYLFFCCFSHDINY